MLPLQSCGLQGRKTKESGSLDKMARGNCPWVSTYHVPSTFLTSHLIQQPWGKGILTLQPTCTLTPTLPHCTLVD